jgi:hypothetical protein
MSDTDHGTLAVLLAAIPPGAVYAVEEVGATGAARQISSQDIRDLAVTLDGMITDGRAYAQLTINAATGGQAVTTAYENVTEWDLAVPASSDMAAVVAGTITPTNAGVYLVSFHGTAACASAAAMSISAGVAGAEVGHVVDVAHVSTEQQTYALETLVTITAGQAISIRIIAGASETITFEDASFIVRRVA